VSTIKESVQCTPRARCEAHCLGSHDSSYTQPMHSLYLIVNFRNVYYHSLPFVIISLSARCLLPNDSCMPMKQLFIVLWKILLHGVLDMHTDMTHRMTSMG
jgi:hypothetical protein